MEDNRRAIMVIPETMSRGELLSLWLPSVTMDGGLTVGVHHCSPTYSQVIFRASADFSNASKDD
jgi:hypothetical protein